MFKLWSKIPNSKYIITQQNLPGLKSSFLHPTLVKIKMQQDLKHKDPSILSFTKNHHNSSYAILYTAQIPLMLRTIS